MINNRLYFNPDLKNNQYSFIISVFFVEVITAGSRASLIPNVQVLFFTCVKNVCGFSQIPKVQRHVIVPGVFVNSVCALHKAGDPSRVYSCL